MEEFALTLCWRLPVSATPAPSSLLTMPWLVFGICPLKPALVLPPSSSPPSAGPGFHVSHLLPGKAGVHPPPACISPNTSGRSVRVWRLCQMEKHQEKQCLSSLMLLLLPTGLRINWVNPRKGDRLLSSCSHSKLWSDLDSFHLLTILLHLEYFKII